MEILLYLFNIALIKIVTSFINQTASQQLNSNESYFNEVYYKVGSYIYTVC